MKTIIEVGISDPVGKPKLKQYSPGHWAVTFEIVQRAQYTRAVWVRTSPDWDEMPKDGKGFVVGPTRKLTVG